MLRVGLKWAGVPNNQYLLDPINKGQNSSDCIACIVCGSMDKHAILFFSSFC